MCMTSKVYLMMAWHELSICSRSLHDYTQNSSFHLVESILTPTLSQAACFLCYDCLSLSH